jgi:FkbM family methyltransferase
VEQDLIFDIGMHDGTDTEYYLRKGFRVVAVEADPDLAAAGEKKFQQEISSGRLTIVNRAIAGRPGTVTLYKSTQSLWSSIDVAHGHHAELKGERIEPVEVDAITSAQLLEEFSTPYYMKIDIEGLDLVALRGLHKIDGRPRYISIESGRRDIQWVREELDAFRRLGYRRFKVVPQHLVHKQKEPDPPREGTKAGDPVHHSSGLFGEDLPGKWLTEEQAVDAYRRPLLNRYLTGGGALIKNRWARAALKRTGFRAGWYDTHAKLGD